MTSPLPIRHNFSLRELNTFGVDGNAHAYLQILDPGMLQAVRNDASLAEMPRLILGGGSNILLTRDFPGLVLHMCNGGIEIAGENDAAVFVRAGAGENWHRFVEWTLAHGFGGLENLSLIPGNVGAAPIQNIGAYGVEVKDSMHSLRAFDFASGEILTLSNADCEFAYRDSVFKHRLRDTAVILDVTFALPKNWRANVRYAELEQELANRSPAATGPAEISAAIIAIRTRKLPDPARIGNAGSFFKNPVVSVEQRNALHAAHPHLVSYAQPDGRFKLAAGWLIDQCGWKGKSLGKAGVYEKQALVLINRGGADGREIMQLAEAIQGDVEMRFGVRLEPEPVFV